MRAAHIHSNQGMGEIIKGNRNVLRKPSGRPVGGGGLVRSGDGS